jgi:glutamine synthetase
MSQENVEKLIKDNQVEFVDLRFVDMRGVQQHVTFPVSIVEPSLFEEGKMFDGSSIAGWKGINESDMVLLPDPDTAYVDPFYADPTLVLTCDVLEPSTMQGYSRDPRGIAKRAEAYLKSSGIADMAFFGPEPEFFIFDSVRFANDMGHTFFEVGSEEGAWNSGAKLRRRQQRLPPGVKGGYFPVPPTDTLHDLRAEMCKVLEQVGIEVEVHHHEVATAGQCEIGTKFNTLVKKADELLR